jgi:uncharacterized protein (DUF2147 family)
MNRTMLLGLSSLLASSQAFAGGQTSDKIMGVWMNPYSSVAVEIAPCAEKVCGRVVWASKDANDDARDAGVDKLIGTELLEGYTSRGDGTWKGTVYVPDLKGHFSSTIKSQGPSTLKISGCLLGGFICKSQEWQRFTGRPGA